MRPPLQNNDVAGNGDDSSEHRLRACSWLGPDVSALYALTHLILITALQSVILLLPAPFHSCGNTEG